VGDSLQVWNGGFRDDVRDFFRGTDGSVGRIAKSEGNRDGVDSCAAFCGIWSVNIGP